MADSNCLSWADRVGCPNRNFSAALDTLCSSAMTLK